MVRLLIDVNNISYVLDYYDTIKVYRSDTEVGGYVEITDVGTRLSLIPEQTKYYYDDVSGDNINWYRTSYFDSVGGVNESDQSVALRGGTEVEKIGYTFGNYKPAPGEWGHAYTPDDIRYTMMFGIDSVGSDVAQSEFTDEQFKQIVREAVGEFEAFLTMDITRRVYKCFEATPNTTLIRARIWREGVDYTDEDDSYDFDPRYWKEYGFLQLRHWPLISVERAIWYSPVKGEIMNLVENDWIRLQKGFAQIRFFPKGGFSYGPYSVYGPLWTGYGAARYPGGFEIDYTTGIESSDFIPEGLRSAIGKYATIKALAVVGDGLLAGFSSQSISLDGLSESFSSTQSATSIRGDTQLSGYGTIEEMYLEGNWHGKEILSKNRRTGKLELKRILDVLKHDCSKKKSFKIETEKGNRITITEDHSLFTLDMQEIRGSDIKIGTILQCENYKDNVSSVIETKINWMFDLSVEDNENFIANGFVVHNSSYFGARIKQYSDEINDWLTRNRYKYSPVPLSFVGAE